MYTNTVKKEQTARMLKTMKPKDFKMPRAPQHNILRSPCARRRYKKSVHSLSDQNLRLPWMRWMLLHLPRHILSFQELRCPFVGGCPFSYSRTPKHLFGVDCTSRNLSLSLSRSLIPFLCNLLHVRKFERTNNKIVRIWQNCIKVTSQYS